MSGTDPNRARKIPFWLKILFSALFLVTIPSNVINYSAINLLWFCDVAIILTFFGLWFESSLLLSMAALSSVPTQLLWQVDYFYYLITESPLFGFTDYMFAPDFSSFNYAVSLFHVWMPYVLLYSLRMVRYNRLAVFTQSVVGCVVILLSFLLTKDMFGPVGNLNKVYGLSDNAPQTWMHPWLWIIVVMLYCSLCIYAPMHFLFMRIFKPTKRKQKK